MMIVDLYSALRRAPLLRYVSRCTVKRNVFSADRKDPMLTFPAAFPSLCKRRSLPLHCEAEPSLKPSISLEWTPDFITQLNNKQPAGFDAQLTS